MAAIVSDMFRVFNAETFIEQVSNDPNSPDASKHWLYLFIGKIDEWADDNYPPVPLDNEEEGQYENWDQMQAAKRISANDVAHVIPRFDWINDADNEGIVAYNSFDQDQFKDDKKFYVLTQPEFNVYKCIQAGNGPATDKPFRTDDQIFGGTDGYEWKYMYTIGAGDALKFVTPQHMPVRNYQSDGVTPASFPNIGNGKPDSENDIDAAPSDKLGNVGHNYDNIRELGGYYVAINTKLEYGEPDQNDLDAFTTENDFRQIGLVMDPIDVDTNAVAMKDVYRQTTAFTLSAGFSDFYLDEYVTVGSNRAQVVQHQDGTLFVKKDESAGDFVFPATGTIVAEADAARTADYTARDQRDLAPYTGDVIYIENRRPIPRATDQTESLTIILEF